MLSRASLRSRSRRSALVADVDATPPPPNLEPARFCDTVSPIVARAFASWLTHLIIHGVLLVWRRWGGSRSLADWYRIIRWLCVRTDGQIEKVVR